MSISGCAIWGLIMPKAPRSNRDDPNVPDRRWVDVMLETLPTFRSQFCRAAEIVPAIGLLDVAHWRPPKKPSTNFSKGCWTGRLADCVVENLRHTRGFVNKLQPEVGTRSSALYGFSDAPAESVFSKLTKMKFVVQLLSIDNSWPPSCHIFRGRGMELNCQFKATNLPCQQMLIGGKKPHVCACPECVLVFICTARWATKNRTAWGTTFSHNQRHERTNNNQHNSQRVGLKVLWSLYVSCRFSCWRIFCVYLSWSWNQTWYIFILRGTSQLRFFFSFLSSCKPATIGQPNCGVLVPFRKATPGTTLECSPRRHRGA